LKEKRIYWDIQCFGAILDCGVRMCASCTPGIWCNFLLPTHLIHINSIKKNDVHTPRLCCYLDFHTNTKVTCLRSCPSRRLIDVLRIAAVLFQDPMLVHDLLCGYAQSVFKVSWDSEGKEFGVLFKAAAQFWAEFCRSFWQYTVANSFIQFLVHTYKLDNFRGGGTIFREYELAIFNYFIFYLVELLLSIIINNSYFLTMFAN
jgi:hypothetical protein